MAIQTLVDNGGYANDPNADTLYAAFTKLNNNMPIIDGLFLQGEYITSTGVLVYPSGVAQTVTYHTDGRIKQYQTTSTYDGYIWTLLMEVYDGNDNVVTMRADNAGGGNIWRKYFTYNSFGQLITEGAWT